MNRSQTNESGGSASGPRRQSGPPLGVLAAVSTALLVAGIALSAALGGVLASPFEDADTIREYFLTQSDAVKASGVLVLQWTLARPAVRVNEPLVRALHDLAFLTGGPAHVVFLGLLLAGIAVPGLLLGLLPRPLAWAGLVIAVVAELTTLALIWPRLAVLLPIARFPALVWLIAVGVLLPHRRARRDTSIEVRAGGTQP